MTHILFLMSDTGGGHRAACRAIEAALIAQYPGQFSFDMADLWKDYTPYPFSTMPKTYTKWVNRSPLSYAVQYWMNDHIFRLPTISNAYCRMSFPRMQRLYAEHPADMIVCVHSVFVRPTIYALRRLKMTQPFVTVITDYALPNVLWYDPRVDRTLVPTEPSYQRGLRLGIPADKMRITGAPVHPKFTHLALTKQAARDQLGWPQDVHVALIVGGGEGMGPVVKTAQAVDQVALPSSATRPLELAIIAGRNEALKAALESVQWQRKTHIYGFVDNMQVFMRAADVLITKAGPGTITEAAALGLPLIINGAIRFQESPNTGYVVAHGAGVNAPGPHRAAAALAKLLADGGKPLAALEEGVKRIAKPEAIWTIAEEIRAMV